jgi:hypothetical protein
MHPVKWDTQVRIRHLGSGKYLSVDPNPLQTTSKNGAEETWYATRLVDDDYLGEGHAAAVAADGDGDDIAMRLGGGDNQAGGGGGGGVMLLGEGAVEGDNLLELADRNCMLFTLGAADATESVFVPRSDVGLWLEHRVKDVRSGVVRSVYLHNSEEAKPKRSDEAEESLTSDGPTSTIKSFHLVFSSSKSVQDTFKVRKH